MTLLRLIACVGLLGLGSCSYRFDIKAVMIDGKLAFVADGPSAGQARCVSRIQVLPPGYTEAAEGESEIAWRERAFTWSDYGGYECQDQFPIVYGEPLKGHDRDGEPIPREVAPKALEVGVIYAVTATAGSTGYGGGSFRLKPDGSVEALGPAPMVTR